MLIHLLPILTFGHSANLNLKWLEWQFPTFFFLCHACLQVTMWSQKTASRQCPSLLSDSSVHWNWASWSWWKCWSSHQMSRWNLFTAACALWQKFFSLWFWKNAKKREMSFLRQRMKKNSQVTMWQKQISWSQLAVTKNHRTGPWRQCQKFAWNMWSLCPFNSLDQIACHDGEVSMLVFCGCLPSLRKWIWPGCDTTIHPETLLASMFIAIPQCHNCNKSSERSDWTKQQWFVGGVEMRVEIVTHELTCWTSGSWMHVFETIPNHKLNDCAKDCEFSIQHCTKNQHGLHSTLQCL